MPVITCMGLTYEDFTNLQNDSLPNQLRFYNILSDHLHILSFKACTRSKISSPLHLPLLFIYPCIHGHPRHYHLLLPPFSGLSSCMAPRATGKKVKLELIKNSAAGKATFKRKLGPVKVSELSILCGVEAMAIVMSPYDPRPEAWLSTQQVQCSLYKFKNPPELKKKKNMLDQEGHFQTEIKKIEDQPRRAADEAAKFKAEQRLMELLSGASVGLNDLTIDELDVMQAV